MFLYYLSNHLHESQMQTLGLHHIIFELMVLIYIEKYHYHQYRNRQEKYLILFQFILWVIIFSELKGLAIVWFKMSYNRINIVIF